MVSFICFVFRNIIIVVKENLMVIAMYDLDYGIWDAIFEAKVVDNPNFHLL
jgi:hypothetical protein